MADNVALAQGIAGLDAEKDAKVNHRITTWLDKVQALSASEFRTKRAQLQQEAKALVGEADPLQVARHYLLRDLAELLANPRLPAAIAGLLRAAKD